jgi:NAD(P)-dependent dehydrogenase (short-subunit alcohol dehydrogenase family)
MAKAGEIIEKTGAKVVYVRADLEKVEDAQAVVRACDETFGRVDALVDAGASTDRGTILDTTPKLFDRMVAINVRAPFFLIQKRVKIMRRERSKEPSSISARCPPWAASPSFPPIAPPKGRSSR